MRYPAKATVPKTASATAAIAAAVVAAMVAAMVAAVVTTGLALWSVRPAAAADDHRRPQSTTYC